MPETLASARQLPANFPRSLAPAIPIVTPNALMIISDFFNPVKPNLDQIWEILRVSTTNEAGVYHKDRKLANWIFNQFDSSADTHIISTI
jgi:hypothetical protein